MKENSHSYRKEAILFTDGYKLDHRRQYPEGTEMVYANMTPRSCNWYPEAEDGAVVFGLQYLIKEYLTKRFNEDFFNRPKDEVVNEFARRVNTFLGKNGVGTKHIEELHDLGYLPIRIKALPEGSLCPMRVPMLTIQNTHPDFFWLTNYLETLISTELWLPCTSATTARLFKKELMRHAEKTGTKGIITGFNIHDFSMRGMGGVESAVMSGMGHMTSFCGSETLPAIAAVEEYYNADAEKELIAGTVPATEHSVMEAGGKETEYDTYKRLLTQVYPEGFVSIVSDTWDFWKVMTETIPSLKDVIMQRDGRFVVRPDSGEPIDIICGIESNFIYNYNGKKYYDSAARWSGSSSLYSDYERAMHDHIHDGTLDKYEVSDAEIKGAYELLLDTFGYSVNGKGYKVLDTHVGLIYGDSITLWKQKEIYRILENKGIAATNIVLGVGSYSYQLKSRDSLGFAVKTTAVRINGELIEVFKSPKTDRGIKKSLKGLLRVDKDENGKFYVTDRVSEEDEKGGELVTVFEDGKLVREISLEEIRTNVDNTL